MFSFKVFAWSLLYQKIQIKPGTLILYKQIFQECYCDLDCLQTAGFSAITQILDTVMLRAFA